MHLWRGELCTCFGKAVPWEKATGEVEPEEVTLTNLGFVFVKVCSPLEVPFYQYTLGFRIVKVCSSMEVTLNNRF